MQHFARPLTVGSHLVITSASGCSLPSKWWPFKLTRRVWGRRTKSTLALLGSIALFLLGASGMYLWFSLHDERVAGAVVLIAGLAAGLGSPIFSRMA